MNRIPIFLAKISLAALLLLFMTPTQLEAQRMGHRASRSSMSRPAARPSAPAARPSSRPTQASRPSSSNRSSINGGYKKTPSRDISRPSTGQANRSAQTSRPANTDRSASGLSDRSSGVRTSEVSRPGNSREANGNRVNSGNRVNVDNNRRGDINIDNSRNLNVNRRNTVVVASPRVYVRPPYVWGGFHFYCHSPYYWHPYSAWYWGPVWHPWGFFVATLATTAIIVSVTNDNSTQDQYHYDQGNYYIKTDNGYEVVQAPVGATVNSIPDTAEKVQVTENTYNYYYGGAYYEKDAEGYTVVPATAGTIVPHLPEGGEEVKVGDRNYVKFGETYYQPIQVDGKDMYEIVEVQPES